MTVLTQAIEKIKTLQGGELHPDNLIAYLKSLLPAEEQQTRDAWGKGMDRGKHESTKSEFYFDYEHGDYPDLETYLSNLKQQP